MEIILTAIAKDRPGIVEEIAAVITEHNGNWVESSMSRLGGEFAGIVQVTAPAANKDQIIAGLKSLGENGISIECKVDQQVEPSPARSAELELTGLDHAGIVRDITRLLAGMEISIDRLETRVFTASMAGEPMFHARAEIRLPDTITPEQLTEAVETIANDIMVDINLNISES